MYKPNHLVQWHLTGGCAQWDKNPYALYNMESLINEFTNK